MPTTLDQDKLLQGQYELAMAIGTSLDLGKMLRASMRPLLKLVSAPAGAVLFHERAGDGVFRLRNVFSIPRDINRLEAYKTALIWLPGAQDQRQLADFKSRLPFVGKAGEGKFFHVANLADIGIVVILRNGDDLDPRIIRSLGPLLAKLADACTACLDHKELLEHRDRLQTLVDAHGRAGGRGDG